MKKRLLVFLFLSTIGWMILFGRVVYIQVILGEELQQKAYEQQTRDRLITPKRGSILDRNGVGLAVTETVNSVSVIPVQIKEKEQTAKYLADILELKYDTVLEKIKQNVKYKFIGTSQQSADTDDSTYIEFINNRFELLSADSYYYMGTYVENGDNLTLNIESINLGGEEMNLSKDEIGGEIQFKGKITNSGETIVITIENEELKFEL